MKKTIIIAALLLAVVRYAVALPLLPVPSDSTASVVDEVVWVVGDEAILKSDIETMRLQAAQEGVRFKGSQRVRHD